jgi:outer membrane protein TolC
MITLLYKMIYKIMQYFHTRQARMVFLPLFVGTGILMYLSTSAYAKEISKEDRIREDKINVAIEEAEKRLATQDDLITRARRHLNVLEKVEAKESLQNKAQAGQLLQEASIIYRDKSQYMEAYELADEAMKLYPENGDVERFKKRILKDMVINMTDSLPYGRNVTPPEGMLAYKVAISNKIITIEEAINIALKNSIPLASQRMKLKGDRRKLTEAKRALFPNLSFEASANGGITAAAGAYQGESWKFNADQVVFDGGELMFTVRQAETSLKSDEAEYNKTRLDLIHQVGETYRGVLNADYNLAYQRSLFDEVQQVQDRSEKEKALGFIPEADYLDLLSVYNQVSFQFESAKIGLDSAKMLFGQTLGLSPEYELPIDTTLRYKEIEINLGTLRQMVQRHNWDIKVSEMAAKGAYYGVLVFKAQKSPKVTLRGSLGITGEEPVGAGRSNDLEDEHFIGVEVEMPIGPNSIEYSFNRRFFGPTVLALTGSEDFRHRVTLSLLDKLSNLTDEDGAKADYLQALAELKKERSDQDIASQDAYYSYRAALLQMNTSLSKIKYREKQVNILRVMSGLQESSVSQLLSEMVALSEDRFSYVKAISDIHDSVSNINRIIGIQDFYTMDS